MKKVIKEEVEPEVDPMDEFEYGVSDIVQEIDEKTELMGRTRNRQDKILLKKRVEYLMDLYNNVTGMTHFKKK